MSYYVLARKYRPQTFEEIVGQPHITRTLTNAIESDRVAHAYLFTGTRGVGKTTAARILAKALNCEKGPAPTPCNACASCKSITKGTSVDVFEIDGASNTGVDDVRELRENARFMPQFSRYKIYVIDEVHMLSTSAFNALLKTLEEPPEHVTFIFATTEPHKIPETVLSRCQQYDFKMIPQRQILDHLSKIIKSEKVELEEAALHMIARKADGSMRDAMSFLDQALSFGGDKISTADLLEILGAVDRQVLFDLSKGILAGNADDTLAVLERLQRTSLDVRQFYGDLLEHFRNLTVTAISKKPEANIDTTAEEIAALVKQAGASTVETLQRLFNMLVDNEDMVIRSGNPRLVLEMTLLSMAYSAPVPSLDQVLDQLAQVQNSLAKKGGAPDLPFPESPRKNNPDGSARPKATAKKKRSASPKPAPASLVQRFLEALKDKNGMLQLFFEKAPLLNQSEHKLVYGFDDAMVLRQIENMRADFEAAVKIAGGGDAVIEIVAVQGEKKENELLARRRRKQEATARLAQLKRESRNEEVIQWINERFEDTEISVEPIDKDNS